MTTRRENTKPKTKEEGIKTNLVQAKQKQTNANDTLALEGGKFCLDVAKLVFAGVILAGIMKEDANTTLLYAIGVVVVMFFVVFGFYLIKHSKKCIGGNYGTRIFFVDISSHWNCSFYYVCKTF